MYVTVAVLEETQPHERRVALVPCIVPKLGAEANEALADLLAGRFDGAAVMVR